MKNKFIVWLEGATDAMFSEVFQAKALIATFGVLGICCLVGSFWNPSQLIFASICALIVLCGISEYQKAKRK